MTRSTSRPKAPKLLLLQFKEWILSIQIQIQPILTTSAIVPKRNKYDQDRYHHQQQDLNDETRRNRTTSLCDQMSPPYLTAVPTAATIKLQEAPQIQGVPRPTTNSKPYNDGRRAQVSPSITISSPRGRNDPLSIVAKTSMAPPYWYRCF